MPDYKMLQAGDSSALTTPAPKQSEFSTKCEMAEGALDWLITRTRSDFTGEERAKWQLMFEELPAWKLARVREFTKPFVNEVWEFFGSLQPEQNSERAPARQLPEPISSIGRDCFAHVKMLTAWTGSREDRLRAELAGLKTLHGKYPHAGFDRLFGEKRFRAE